MKYFYCLLLCLFSLNAPNSLFAQCGNDQEPPAISCVQTVTMQAAPGICTASVTVAKPEVSDNCTPAETLDQQNTSANSGIGTSPGGYYNQSFTANITGYLTRLDINISGFYGSANVSLNIYDGDNTNYYLPSGPLLSSQDIVLSTGFPTFILSQPLHVIKGHMYTWQITGPNTQISGSLGTDNPYAGGHLGSYSTGDNGLDLLFKTYVLPNAVTFTNDYNNSDDASGVYPVGITAVTWTAIDFSGNRSTCVTTITVIDDQLPVIAGCPSDVASCAGVVNWTAPTVTDNCGITSFTSNYPPGATFPPGSTTVTYTAVDIHGNMATCSFNVTVTDVKAQITGNTLLCPGATTTLSAAGNYSRYVWSTGAQTQSIIVSTPGKYVLTTSENNCTAKDSVIITVSSLTDKGYQTNGDAFANGSNCFTLTPAESAKKGSVWYKDKINLNYDFDMSFTTNQCGTADGMMFVLQNSGTNALGSNNGSTLGYYQTPAFSKSLGVELDIYNSGLNDPFYDPSASHISIVTNDNAYPLSGAVNVAPGLNNCADRAFRVTWNHTTHLFSVYLDGALITSYTSDLVATVFGGNSSVYMGFTGATGGSNATQMFCTNSLQYTNGPLTVSQSAGTLCGSGQLYTNAAPGSTFQWSTGAATDSITITSSGHYSVTVSNGDGCSQTVVYDAVVIPVPTITADGATTNICPGTTVNLTASSGISYSWSNGVTTPSIAVGAAGTYNVTVDGCIATSGVAVTYKPVLSISASGPTTFCPGYGIDLTVSGGASYLWSTGATAQSIHVTDSGSYSVQVTHTDGCVQMASQQTHVQPLAKPELLSYTGTELCNSYYGFSDFFVGNVDYSLTYTVNSDSVNDYGSGYFITSYPGTYMVTAQDQLGCVSSPATIAITAAPGDPSVFGNNTWNVYVFDDYYYGIHWTQYYFDGYDTYNFYKGYYSDSSFSFDTRNRWGENGAPSDASGYQGCSVNSDYHSWSAKRKGFPCGHYKISIPGHDDDAELYINGSLVWQQSGATSDSSVVWEGDLGANTSIEFRGEDNYGGSFGAIHFISLDSIVPPVAKPVITPSGSMTICSAAPLTLTSSAGTGNLWSTGDTTQSISVKTTGNYSVKVSNACSSAASDTVSVSVTQAQTYYRDADGDGYGNPNLPLQVCTAAPTGYVANSNDCDDTHASVHPGATEVCDGLDNDCNGIIDDPCYSPVVAKASPKSASACLNDGTIKLSGSGGKSPYQYSLDGSSYVTANTFTGLASGAYTGYVKDSRHAVGTVTTTVSKVPAVTVTSSTVSTSACLNNGKITLGRTGGTSPFTYSLDGTNYVSTNVFSNLATGTYTGYVKDAKGCTASKPNIVVGQIAAVTVTSSTVGASACADDGKVTLGRTGGTSPFTYSLDGITYGTSNVFTGLAAGIYTGYVKDSKGCATTKGSIIVAKLPAMVVKGSTISASACLDDGKITLSRTNGTLPFTYSLDGITYATTTVFSNLASGTYTGYVKDAKGCIATKDSIVVGKLPAMIVSSTTVSASPCLDDGKITLSRTSGSSPFTYSLDGNTYITTDVFTGLVAGTYTGYVKDAKGCIANKENILVGKLPEMVVSYTKTNATKCPSNGTITLSRTGGTSPYLYSLNGATYVSSNKFSNLTPGTYMGYVKDGKGCIATSSAIVITGTSCSTITTMTKSNEPVLIKRVDNRSVKISPNPANSLIKVQLFGYAGKTEIQLRSLDGKVLKTQAITASASGYTETQFSVADLASGLYFVTTLDVKGDATNFKVVVAH